ncbi:chromate transporter [Rudaeicoccus suwonensis]|uniref:Chromate transporter n=1 Tax=Rudaeicoccus suwonensis TaxID=657409 RepID=A0A561E461_9MICO|nr:chromate transporter [Rudaeicoccus suwonensis]TWE10371.1 chromate transporter [Rudaeicoccus suwonensis]
MTNEVETPTKGQLFTGFLVLGATGFGGVLPLSRRMIVERRGWLDAAEFAQLLALCQFLPGGNVVNLSVVIGRRFHGRAGAVCAAGGLLAVPTLLVIMAWTVYSAFDTQPLVHAAMWGLAAGASGLVGGVAVRLLLALRAKPQAAVVALAVLAAIWLLGISLPIVLVAGTAVALLMVRPEQSR